MTKAEKLRLLRAIVDANESAGRDRWHGLQSHEIGTLNGALMFGDNDEAFPEQWEWRRITD